jgi:O-antigen/teichoic acid export membrane protein
MNENGQASNGNVSPVKQIVKDFGYYIPSRLIPALTGIAAVAIYTRLLSPQQYGAYTLAITTISIAVFIASGWLNQGILRYFEECKQSGSLPELTSIIIISSAGAAILSLLASYIVIPLLRDEFDPELVSLFRIGLLVFMVQVGYSMILALKRAGRESSKYALYSVLNALCKLGIAVILLYFFDLGPEGVLWGMVIGAGGILLWELHRMYSKLPFHFPQVSKRLFKKLLAYGVPLIGVSAVSLIHSSADRYMIGYFLGAGDVGAYSASYNISYMGVQFLASILMFAAYPVIVQNFASVDKDATRGLLTRTTAMYIVSTMPVAFGITALSREIGTVFLGQAFQASYKVIPWIAWAGFCYSLIQYVIIPFQLKEKTRILLYIVLFAATLNIVLNLFFIRRFGILGAAYSTLISYFAYLLVAWLLSRKILIWNFPMKSSAKSLFAALGMYVVLFSIQIGRPASLGFLVLKVFLGAASYTIIMLMLREAVILQGVRYLFGHFSGKNRSGGRKGNVS